MPIRSSADSLCEE